MRLCIYIGIMCIYIYIYVYICVYICIYVYDAHVVYMCIMIHPD